MNSDFNKMPWHDSEILNIAIDRANLGNNDRVVIDICWCNGDISQLIFKDCYALEFQMNFGVIAPESILDAYSTNQSLKLDLIREKWKQGVDLNNLSCFEIETNSTASVLHIYSLSYEIIDKK